MVNLQYTIQQNSNKFDFKTVFEDLLDKCTVFQSIFYYAKGNKTIYDVLKTLKSEYICRSCRLALTNVDPSTQHAFEGFAISANNLNSAPISHNRTVHDNGQGLMALHLKVIFLKPFCLKPLRD